MEIAPGIYSMMERKGIYVHAFLLDYGAGLILIDTLHSTNAAIILEELKRIGKTPADIKFIVMTHAHRAHLGGLALLQKASGAQVYSHDWEADIIEGDRKPQCMSLGLMRPYRLWPFQIASRFGSHPPCRVERAIKNDDAVGPVQVIYTPGHTPGHLAFYWPERKALFVGDALVNYPEFGPGWKCFMLNERQNLASLEMMSKLDFEFLGVGHGDPIPSGGGSLLRALISQ